MHCSANKSAEDVFRSLIRLVPAVESCEMSTVTEIREAEFVNCRQRKRGSLQRNCASILTPFGTNNSRKMLRLVGLTI